MDIISSLVCECWCFQAVFIFVLFRWSKMDNGRLTWKRLVWNSDFDIETAGQEAHRSRNLFETSQPLLQVRRKDIYKIESESAVKHLHWPSFKGWLVHTHKFGWVFILWRSGVLSKPLGRSKIKRVPVSLRYMCGLVNNKVNHLCKNSHMKCGS